MKPFLFLSLFVQALQGKLNFKFYSDAIEPICFCGWEQTQILFEFPSCAPVVYFHWNEAWDYNYLQATNL